MLHQLGRSIQDSERAEQGEHIPDGCIWRSDLKRDPVCRRIEATIGYGQENDAYIPVSTGEVIELNIIFAVVYCEVQDIGL